MSAEQSNPILVRPLRPADIPAIAEFEREIARISFPEDPVDDIAFYERKLAAAARDSKNHLIVLEQADRIAGWAWIAPRTNFITKETYGDLRSFYIAAPARGTACAMRLMRACLDFCREKGLSRVVGRTNAANVNMQAIYRLFEFQPKHVTYELFLREDSPVRDR